MRKLMFITTVILIIIATGCKGDEIIIPPKTTSYNLVVKDVLGVSGTVTFTETSATQATIDIELIGAPAGSHPAELCANSAVEGGTATIVLNPVGLTGKSSTVTTELLYNQLIAYDGFIQIHQSSFLPNEILAVSDIGGNVITETNITYPMSSVLSYGVMGSALFQKRMNGNTLVTLIMTGLLPGEYYPASINVGSVETVGGGEIKKTLNDVNGNTGKSMTNIKSLNSTILINYDNWLVYDGYINIYRNTASYANIISHGNIGSN